MLLKSNQDQVIIFESNAKLRISILVILIGLTIHFYNYFEIKIDNLT